MQVCLEQVFNNLDHILHPVNLCLSGVGLFCLEVQVQLLKQVNGVSFELQPGIGEVVVAEHGELERVRIPVQLAVVVKPDLLLFIHLFI